jgi:hypothetical protein
MSEDFSLEFPEIGRKIRSTKSATRKGTITWQLAFRFLEHPMQDRK